MIISHNRLLKDLGRITYDAVSETHPTLEGQLNHLLTQMIDAQEGVLLSDTVRELTRDVVYFVLNTTELSETKRAFVAGMNWANLNDAVKNGQLVEKCHEDLQIDCASRIFSTNKEVLSKPQDKIVSIPWKCIWAEYARITAEKEQEEQPLYTLNHWLLNYTRNPHNIGFYWGNENIEADDCYFQLDDALLQNIGIFPASNFHDAPILPPIRRPSNPVINDILGSFRDMDCLVERCETPENVSFCLYHLLRSYGCWGGTAFVSIPVAYGNRNYHKIGILSICTSKPMRQKQVMLWSLVANKIFKDIMFSHLDKLLSKALLVQSTYGIGHMYKNRTSQVLTGFEAFRQDVSEALHDAAARLDNFKSETKNNPLWANALESIQEKQTEINLQAAIVRANIDQINTISNVLDIISRTLDINGSKVFLEKEKWRAKSPLNFSQNIETWAKHLERDGKRPIIRLEVDFPVQIECFIPDEKEPEMPKRPADFLYKETVAEVIINGLKYGKLSGRGSVDFRFGYDAESKTFFLSNQVNDAEWKINEDKLKKGNLEPGKWLPVDSFTFGGVFYLHHLFKQTHTGELLNRITKTPEGEYEFAIGFKFEGLMST